MKRKFEIPLQCSFHTHKFQSHYFRPVNPTDNKILVFKFSVKTHKMKMFDSNKVAKNEKKRKFNKIETITDSFFYWTHKSDFDLWFSDSIFSQKKYFSFVFTSLREFWGKKLHWKLHMKLKSSKDALKTVYRQRGEGGGGNLRQCLEVH